jgi:hypothetical protein
MDKENISGCSIPTTSTLKQLFRFCFFKNLPIVLTEDSLTRKGFLNSVDIKFEEIESIIPQSKIFLFFFKVPGICKINIVRKKRLDSYAKDEYNTEENEDNDGENENSDEKEKDQILKELGTYGILSGPTLKKTDYTLLLNTLRQNESTKRIADVRFFKAKRDSDTSINKSSVWIDGEQIYSVQNRRHRNFAYSGNPQRIVFFNTNKKKIYFGYREWQMDLDGFSEEEAVALKNAITESGSKIGMENKDVYESYYGFLEWLKFWKPKYRETLSLNDDAVIFLQKGRKKTDTIYLPYKDIYVAGAKHRKLNIFGAQHIFSQHRFSNLAIENLKKELKKHEIEEDIVTTYTPSIFGGFWSWLLNKTWIKVSDKKVIFKGPIYPFIRKNDRDELDKSKKSISYYPMQDVVFCKSYRKHFYSLHRTIYIVFNIKDSFRKDQKNKHDTLYELVRMKHLWWFNSGSIKRRIKKVVDKGLEDQSNSMWNWKKITKNDFKRK